MTKFSASQQSQLAQIGAFLRENREKQSKSLEDIAIRTYIRPQLLSGIETGNPDLLPEPIFVQGFIRRYGETLGLKGTELAQQFTVTSIPDTPRPERSTQEPKHSTTRLTRQVSSPSAATALGAAVGPQEPHSPDPSPAPTDIPLIVDHTALAQANTPTADILELEPSAPENAPESAPESTPENAPESTPEAPNSTPEMGDNFSSKVVSTFDQQTLSTDTYDSPAGKSDELAPDVLPEISPPEISSQDIPSQDVSPQDISSQDTSSQDIPSQDIPQFDDDLPEALTTQVTTATPEADRSPVHAPEPVGVEPGDNRAGPDPKPFAIGAIVIAAITAGVVLLANMLGGDRTPSVANSEEAPDQSALVEPDTEILPDLPPVPVVETPPASTAPVYIEAEAITATYVSIKTDGVIIFEDIMQPGDKLLWEAQESVDVYSGNAGGLSVSANGGPAEVLGENGQLGQKLFTAP